MIAHLHFRAHRECRVLTEAVLQHLPDAPTAGVSRRLARGEAAYVMGDPTGTTFFVKSGQIVLSVLSPQGQEHRLRTVQPGEMFGELCFCDVRSRQEQAVAVEHSEIVAYDADELLSAILRSPEGTAAMLGTMCARISEAEDQIQRLALHTAPERIGLLLLSLPARINGSQERIINRPLTHEEIARTVGTSRELVSATLSGFRRMGLIRYRRRGAVVIAPDALAGHLNLRKELYINRHSPFVS